MPFSYADWCESHELPTRTLNYSYSLRRKSLSHIPCNLDSTSKCVMACKTFTPAKLL